MNISSSREELKKVALPNLRELKLAILDDQLEDTLHTRAIFGLKVVELMLYESGHGGAPHDRKEVPCLNRYATNDPKVIASLTALQGKGLTVSCFSYPRVSSPK